MGAGTKVHTDVGDATTGGAPVLQASDRELADRLKDGDKSAFIELARRHANSLFGLAYSLLGSAADAEDVVQETMLAAIGGIKSFEGRSSIATWLRSILVFQASKARRPRRIRSATPLHAVTAVATRDDTGLRTESATPTVDSRVDVSAMLATLSGEHREIIVLRELQQLSYDQIAQILKVPTGTVMSRLHRARQELKERFKEYDQ